MSTSPVSENLKNTRQLLDELDALMDRMLALPVHDRDDDANPSPPPPNPMVSATLTMLDVPAPAAKLEEPPLLTSAAAGSYLTEEIRHQTVEEDSAFPAEDALSATKTQSPSAESPRVSVLTEVAAPQGRHFDTLPPPVASAPWAPGNLTYQFLLWVNQGYDRGASWFGRPGRWLRSRQTRALLGLTGLGLLFGALIWLCFEWLGWKW